MSGNLVDILTHGSESISLREISVVPMKDFASSSHIHVQLLVEILSYISDQDLLRISRVCKLWNKVAFLKLMNNAFKYKGSSDNQKAALYLQQSKLATPWHYAPYYYEVTLYLTASLETQKQSLQRAFELCSEKLKSFVESYLVSSEQLKFIEEVYIHMCNFKLFRQLN